MKILEILDEIEKAYPEDMFPPTTEEERQKVIEQFPGFIDRTSAAMGRHLAKVIREKVAKDQEWRERYKQRLMAHGYMYGDAVESAEAAEYDEEISPEEAADDEYYYEMTS